MNQALVICTASFKLGRPSYRGVEVSILLLLLLCVLVSRKAHHWHTIAVRVVVLTHTHLRTQETTTHHHTCAHTHTLHPEPHQNLHCYGNIDEADNFLWLRGEWHTGHLSLSLYHRPAMVQCCPFPYLAQLKPLLSKAVYLYSDLALNDRLASRHARLSLTNRYIIGYTCIN